MELGLDSFAVAQPDAATERAGNSAKRLGQLLEEIVLADQVGLDVFGIGEHHRQEFLDSTPVVILAAAAARTQRIRLASAVTVLSAADPVRVFQEFDTLDLLSRGRAEIVAGRGSFTESFPLFGLALEDYDSLFAEKLDLLLKLREGALLAAEPPPPPKPVKERKTNSASGSPPPNAPRSKLRPPPSPTRSLPPATTSLT